MNLHQENASVVHAGAVRSSPDYGANLRRLMARAGLTIQQVVERSGLDERTVQAILQGHHAIKPHARTLQKLAEGVDAPVDELFQNPSLLAYRQFDRATNPIVDEVVAECPQQFDGWTAAEFDELYSQFGAGGALTRDGTLAAVEHLNRKRQIHAQVDLILETSEASLLCDLVEAIYRRVIVVEAVGGSPTRQRGGDT